MTIFQVDSGVWESTDRSFLIVLDCDFWTVLALRPDGEYEAFPGFESPWDAAEFMEGVI